MTEAIRYDGTNFAAVARFAQGVPLDPAAYDPGDGLGPAAYADPGRISRPAPGDWVVRAADGCHAVSPALYALIAPEAAR